jgi:hypothetical protein
MKVGPREVTNGAAPQTIGNRNETAEKTFHEVLDQTMSGAPVPQDQKALAASEVVMSPTPPHVLSAAEKRQTIERVGKLLDALEDYQRALGDLEVSIKDVHPLISRLEKEKEDLLSIMELLHEGDEMWTLINEVLITTTVETRKYLRGDFI